MVLAKNHVGGNGNLIINFAWPNSPAAIRHNLAIESIVGIFDAWIMFVNATNIKGKRTGHH